MARHLMKAILGALLVSVPSAGLATPVANLSRGSVQFSWIGTYVNVVQPVFITNTGDAPLNVATIALGGGNPGDFRLAGTCAAPIALAANGGRCRLDIVSNLNVGSTAGRTATVTVQSDSTPLIPSIGVSAIADDAVSASFVTPMWIDFAPQPVGTAATPQRFTFTDVVDGPLNVERVLTFAGDAGDFTATTDCINLVVAQSCAITVGFVPTAAGPRSTQLEVDYIAPNDGMHRVRRYSLTGVGGPGLPSFDIHQQGLTGSWYRVATSGQGIELEVFPDLVTAGTGLLQGSWFTFDHVSSGGADHGRWYVFAGEVHAGTTTATLPLYQNVGGNFNAPPVTSPTLVGNVTLAFTDCTNARLDYTFTDGSNRAGSIALTRLTPNVTCSMNGAAGTSADFALSGNWYDATKGGQGFVIEMNPLAPALFLTWYTYAVAGAAQGAAGQRWYTAIAAYAPGARSIPLTLYETTGGLFDASSPTPTSAAVGTATLTFSSCSAARLVSSFTSGSNAGQSTSIDLVRVGPVPAGCAF